MPATELTRALTEIWQRSLPVHEIGPDDDFFALGGDSLAVMIVLAEVETLGFEVNLDVLLEHPTISELAAYLTCERERTG